ncbi:hypothetical protein AJ80_09035 [Polytolypa hystricis UAMH7299]|uniref:Uncharacterized protein n=1 Tax=Polytolypa hystricis (strain UAMH7299) TaxID=1447883 RepID=A0A2B7WXK8_POLH7|nr:hypothetical protein AJ80_09035 [Polytolypa hystricis UAMH7299]
MRTLSTLPLLLLSAQAIAISSEDPNLSIITNSPAVEASSPTPSPSSPHSLPSTTYSFSKPPPPPPPPPNNLKQREIINGPAAAQPHPQPTQVSPVMTVTLGEAQLIFTQTFAKVPDQWPSPSKGSIGLGTLKGEVGVRVTKTVDKRGSEETGSPAAEAEVEGLLMLATKSRCRTLQCRKQLEQAVKGSS